jgi:Cys-tRNA(Pro)/Cys-tRNA(Cys) deacylase
MSTRGIDLLQKKKIPFEVVHYDHQEKGAVYAAQAVGYALSRTVKTLVVTLDQTRQVFVLMPGNGRVSMKKVAAAGQAKRAAMADAETAQRLTGYLVGGISPFGSKRNLPVLMDASLQAQAEIMINAGRRGTMVKLNPIHIIALLKPKLADLVDDYSISKT